MCTNFAKSDAGNCTQKWIKVYIQYCKFSVQVICKILCHKCANYISDLSMEKMQLLKIYSPRILHTEGVKLLHKVGTV